MPELPEVETVRRGLMPVLEGRTIVEVELRRADLRFPFPPDFAERLKGRKVLSVGRRAKYLQLHLSGGLVLVIHLGMSGQLVIHQRAPVARKHDHVLFRFSGPHWLVFNDARRFGLMDLVPEAELAGHKLFAGLGVEPLEEAFDGRHLHALLKGRDTPVKAALMDQRRVVGVGNIYASEALFRAGIHPRRKVARITQAQAERLAGSVKEVLEAAIRSGGSTLRDFVRSSGDSGYFQHAFQVYGREDAPCVRCGNPIKRIIQQGRSTFFCPHCQK